MQTPTNYMDPLIGNVQVNVRDNRSTAAWGWTREQGVTANGHGDLFGVMEMFSN